VEQLDPVLSLVLGGIGGVVLAQFVQVARDELAARWRLRGAARIARTEIVRNLSIVSTYAEYGAVPSELRTLHGHRFERVMDTLASGLPQNEMATLLSHHESLNTANELFERAKGRKFSTFEQSWLKSWLVDAALCQNLAFLRGERFWYRMRHPRTSSAITKQVNLHVSQSPPSMR
jgi:hypothetical protein